MQFLFLMRQLFSIPVPPKIISTEVSADPVVREGDNLTLSCDARGHPKPHIVWRREDSEDIMVDGKKGTVRPRITVYQGPILPFSVFGTKFFICYTSNNNGKKTEIILTQITSKYQKQKYFLYRRKNRYLSENLIKFQFQNQYC